ncbi:MAG: penicillin-binding protein 2 [Acidobacteriota bacterium]
MQAKKKNKNAKDTLQLMNWEATEAAVFNRQYLLLAGIMLLFLMGYSLRLWHLQVLQGETYRYQSENNRVRLEEIPAPRGIIYDRNGVPLVDNRPAYHLLLIREDVEDLPQTLAEVSKLIGRNVQELQAMVDAAKTTPKFVPIRLASDLDRDALARVEAQRVRLPGVTIQVEPKREYTMNGTAPHLIGYLSEITETELKSDQYKGYYAGEDIGKFGVEAAFEQYLHGRRGAREVEVNAVGRRMRVLHEKPPSSGKSLWLTLDIELQKVAEAALEGKTGAIVALDPTNGAVLAMASRPTFDQERFIRGLTREEWNAMSKDPEHPLMNRCIGAAYPPGSTYKPFVALAALKEGVVSVDTSFNCPGFFQFADRKYRCWRDRGHGGVDVERALIQSCDVYFYQSGMRLGVDKIAQWVTQFGLGERTGLGLSGEHPGLIPTQAWKKKATGVPWQKGETISISIGQGFDLATPIQMALGYCAIANGGTVWQPFVVKRIEGDSAEESNDFRGKVKRKLSFDPKHMAIVQKGLMEVVEDERGTAHASRDKSFVMAGKTGTAQVVKLAEGVSRKLLEKLAKAKDRDHAWFVGYAPANDPKIAVATIVEHGGHGASVAAPVVSKVIGAYLNGQTAAHAAP